MITKLFRLAPLSLRITLKDSILFFVYNLYLNFAAKRGKNKFFGQTGEDSEILKFAPEKYGQYIDIGSGHPVIGSNTYYFYRKGWRGITIDPIKDNIGMSKILRRRDISLRMLIGSNSGEIFFWHFEPYEYSTTVETIAIELLKNPQIRLRKKEIIKVCALKDIAFSMSPKDPTILSIDVEGFDLEVLKSNDWSRVIPRVICVEELGNLQPLEDLPSQIQMYLEMQGYILKTRTILSSIFVHKSWV